MSIIDWAANKLGYAKAKGDEYPAWALANAAVESYAPPDLSVFDNQTRLWLKLSWLNTAVHTVASISAITKLSVKRMSGENTRDVPNHDFERLLRRPNPAQSRYQFIYDTISYRRLTGNAYWYLNRTSENEPPAEMWVIPSNRIIPVPDGNSYIKGYLYDPGDGTQIPLETWEVCHFKGFNPVNQFIGASPIETLTYTAVNDLGMQKWNGKLFSKDNGRLPGILAFASQINATDWEKIKSEVADSSNKQKMMMLQAVGTGGVQWLQTATSLRDLEYINGRVQNKEEIWSVFAPGLASILSVNATEANAKTGKSTIIDFAVWPLLVEIAEGITNTIMPAYGADFVTEFDDIRITDRSLRLQEQAEYSKSHTIVEIRKEYYGDDPLGDERDDLLPSQVTQTSGVEEPEPEPETQTDPLIMPPMQTQDADGMDGETGDEDAHAAEAESEDMKRWQRKAVKAIKDGKTAAVSFTSGNIPSGKAEVIRAGLSAAKTADDVRAVFGNAVNESSLAAELKRANDLLAEVWGD